MSNTTLPARFANLQGTTPTAPTPPVVTSPVPVRGVTVDVEGAKRAQSDADFADAQGFATKPPIYTIGTMVVEMGVDNFKASRKGWDEMPMTHEACEELAAQVKREHREDKVVPVTAFKMTANGLLHTRGNGTYPMSARALEGLARFLNPSNGAQFLRDIPVDLRAQVCNRLFPEAIRDDARATAKLITEWENTIKAYADVQAINAARATNGQALKDLPPAPGKYPKPVTTPREVTLRTRDLGKTREIFSTVGPRYGAFDTDKIAKLVAECVEGDSRCDVTYDGYKARINVLFHSNIIPETAVAGEIFKAGVCIETADDGTGAISVSSEVWKNLCLNLLIIDHKEIELGSRRHIGNPERMKADVRKLIMAGQAKIGLFVQKWNEGSVENVLERYGLADMEALFKALVGAKTVHVPNVKPEDLVSRLMTAWQKEPTRTRNGVVNAVTRIAHENSWRSWEVAESLERTGGDLLFAKAWNLEMPKEEVEVTA